MSQRQVPSPGYFTRIRIFSEKTGIQMVLNHQKPMSFISLPGVQASQQTGARENRGNTNWNRVPPGKKPFPRKEEGSSGRRTAISSSAGHAEGIRGEAHHGACHEHQPPNMGICTVAFGSTKSCALTLPGLIEITLKSSPILSMPRPFFSR